MNTTNTDEPAAERPIPLPIGGLGTGVGSIPHANIAEASRIVLGELPDFPFLPELPGRGPHAGTIGRAMALLPEIDADLTTTGWRIGGAAGLEQRRATETLAGDLDAFETAYNTGVESSLGHPRSAPTVLKTQAVGPLTLASGLELPNGQSVLTDHGALRDVTQSLAEGVRVHREELTRRFGIPVVVQVDEPGLPAVLSGTIRRPSGLGRYPALSAEQASGLLEPVLHSGRPNRARHGATSGRDRGRPVHTVVHCCADVVPVELLINAGADAIGFDLSRLAGSRTDEYAMAVENGASLFVGAIPAVRPSEDAPGRSEPSSEPGQLGSVASTVLDWWRRLGFDEELAANRIVLTTSCGSAAADEQWASRALREARDTAVQLSS